MKSTILTQACLEAPPTTFASSLDQAIALLLGNGIKVAVFDMDQTAIVAHSRGQLLRSSVAEYLAKASKDFLDLVPQLHKHGIQLAIATHSDSAEYGYFVRPKTHILGHELAKHMVDHHFEEDIAQAFFIIAFNPRVRKVTNKNDLVKRHHMRVIQEHYQVEPKQIMFFDDVSKIVMDCTEYCGVHAVHVNELLGFQLSDLIEHFQN